MWRRDATRRGAYLAFSAITALALLGAGQTKKKRNDPPPPQVDETVGDLAFIGGASVMKVEGVGLVHGLDDTGADPPPSWARERLLEEMKKASVENANGILGDKRFSMVMVRVGIPTGTTTSDRLDVEVEVPPGCATTSLAGGYLLSCRLKEILIAGGTPKEGPELATAQGPLIVGTDARPNDPKVGRILGGARVKKDAPFTLSIKEKRRSVKTASLLQEVVNRRFHQTEGLDQKGMATGKTDTYLVLRIPRVYHHNQERYFRLVKLLPVVDNPALRQQRLVAWQKELLDPAKAGVAALRLEGVGSTAVDTLKTGLASPNAQVRFFAAEALAYLNDASGAEVLAETVVQKPEFRAYALAALAATDQSSARMKLCKLMDVADIEVRYGAFHALRTSDENDPFLGRVRVLDAPPVEAEEEESMSLAIAGARPRRRAVQDDPFSLYVVDCEGPPLIHVASTRRSEVVIFGRGQRLLTPIVLGSGPILLNAADGDDKLQISKIASGRPGDSDAKVQASLGVDDVVRQVANLGAKYPEVVTILGDASRQKNLPGPLVVDAVPGPNPTYTQAAILGKDTTKKDDAVSRTKLETTRRPRLLDRLFNSKEKEKAEKEKAAEAPAPATKTDAAPAPAPAKAAEAPAPAKRDDAVTKTRLDEPAKPGFFDRLRRRGNP